MMEMNDRTYPMLFICGSGKLYNGKRQNVRLEVSPFKLEDFLNKEIWEPVDEVIIFDDK